ncbi:MAG TPA: response regulator [Myxococcota bacterium]|nr:response regulator [Myxococcota bacterium]
MSDASARLPLVLLVDDEPRILSALRRTLRREPYELLSAESCAEALRVIESQPVDVVLSDHKMPGMTGLQLLERVAARRPRAIRLLITGWTESIPPEEIRAVGVREVISKPWEDAALKESLRRACKDLAERG